MNTIELGALLGLTPTIVPEGTWKLLLMRILNINTLLRTNVVVCFWRESSSRRLLLLQGSKFPRRIKFRRSFALRTTHAIPKIYQKWSSRCKANKMLQDGLKNGSIDPSMKPKDVWESAMEFQKYSLQSFRSAFNRKKTEMGAHLRDDDGTLFPKY